MNDALVRPLLTVEDTAGIAGTVWCALQLKAAEHMKSVPDTIKTDLC